MRADSPRFPKAVRRAAKAPIREVGARSRRREELAKGLERIGREVFGDREPGPEIRWVTVRDGYGFTAGDPSSSSVVVRSVPVGFPDDEREAFLKRVCDLWTEVTGCSDDEIVVTAFDGPLPL